MVRPTDAEVCLKSPGYPENLVVKTTTMTLARWHTNQLEWAHALQSGAIRVTGPRALARMLPTWNLRADTVGSRPDSDPHAHLNAETVPA